MSRGQVRPGETGPLSLKNGGNKITASAWLHRLKAPHAAFVADILRGFAPNRQFARIVVDLDLQARIDSVPQSENRLAMLVFWDFAAASPRVSHSWLWPVLETLEIPVWCEPFIVAAVLRLVWDVHGRRPSGFFVEFLKDAHSRACSSLFV